MPLAVLYGVTAWQRPKEKKLINANLKDLYRKSSLEKRARKLLTDKSVCWYILSFSYRTCEAHFRLENCKSSSKNGVLIKKVFGTPSKCQYSTLCEKRLIKTIHAIIARTPGVKVKKNLPTKNEKHSWGRGPRAEKH